MAAAPTRDLARTTLQLIALGALLVSTYLIVRPFLIAGAWATTIAVATWPLLLALERALGGRRGLAAAVLTLVLLLLVLVPFWVGVTTIVANAKQLVHWSRAFDGLHLPALPAWVGGLPLVGTRLAVGWQRLAAATPEDISTRLAPFARTAVVWLVGKLGSAGVLFVQLLLTVIVVAILYVHGDTAVRGVERFARRLAGAQGVEAVDLAARAIRAVALGVVVTALAQTALAGVGLVLVGVPFATILTAVVFVLAVAQVGAALVLVPVAVWAYAVHGVVVGSVFLVWAVVCGTFDNFLRPVLIKRGADLPLLLVFTGVLGGLVAFGVLGLFVGPMVLAVSYTLVEDWVADAERAAEPAGRAAPSAAALELPDH
jgi:predicted PurR-regulated permease PerM